MQNKLRYKFMLGALLVQMMLFGPAPQLAMATNTPATPVIPEEPFLIISAVQITGGTGHTQEDFIELYNPTNAPLDLNGYRLVKRTAAGTTDTTVQAWSDAKVVLPYHFFLWANSNYSAIAETPDATSSATLADNNGVALRRGSNDSGELVHSIAWGSTANGFHNVSNQNPAASQSLAQENLLEDSEVFIFKPSSPRNSSILLEPEIIPELEPTPEPTPEPQPEPEPPVEDEEPPVEEVPVETPTELPVPESEEPSETPAEINIKITELLPNPSGSDSGLEKIELYNDGAESVNLAGYRLDDVALNDPISSNAYTLPSVTLEAGSYVAIVIPTGKFSLNNTGGDVVTLFNPLGEGIDAVFYEDTTPENKSYSHFESGWEWADSTFGESNGNPPAIEEEETEEENEESEQESPYDNSGLEISEIYADPAGTETEFVEIYNFGEEVAQLSDVEIWVGERHKLLAELELQPGEYYVVEQSTLPVQLRNSGQIVKLMQGSTILSTVTYPLAIDGVSFAKFEDGFLSTTEVTRGKANTLKLPEVIKKAAATAAEKTTVAKTTKAAATKTASKAATVTAKKVAASTVKAETPGLSIDTKSTEAENKEQTPEQKQKDSMGKVIAMGAAAVAAGVIALYKLVFAAGIE